MPMSMPPATIPGPSRWEPTPRWERRYREVLDAGAAVFAEKGYAGASTRDFAERLGIRQASLYYYFSSKEAALAAICELGVKDFIEALRAVIAAPIETAAKLRAAIGIHLSPLRSRPGADYVRVFVRHRHELPDGPRRAIAALARSYQGMIEELFSEGVAKGDLRADLDPKLATLALLGLCNSVITNRTLPRSSTIDSLIEEYAKIVIHGVTSGKGRGTASAARRKPRARAAKP